ncbi:DNA-binding response OmpR family regulator [Trichococcus patagoniensis]|uniref:DNA-binding response OmpR family regulator n=1 Tax=Trichococcus patagoniensis TaxID=382641 RepID=A0A2T5IGI6_9LACT|nr:response regulator transcription factor [Trichococcus patagoniensis]PTQ82925.1 DNA-binding response OmpR family regulator [Trichococcus patagoniensis]
MSELTKILLVEDEEEIAMLERDYLEISGYEVDILSDGLLAVERVLKGDYNLLILDLMLPGKNGYDICREIRDRVDIPILMVTAKTESVDKVRGLGLGADDYIAKPFDPAELVARVKSHLKMYERLKNAGPEGRAENEEGVIRAGKLRIMTKSRKVYKGDQEVKLVNKEFELLSFLANNPNRVFSKEHLVEKIWGYDYLGDGATVTVHINRIREKIEEDNSNPKYIETIWGAGYRFNA